MSEPADVNCVVRVEINTLLLWLDARALAVGAPKLFVCSALACWGVWFACKSPADAQPRLPREAPSLPSVL